MKTTTQKNNVRRSVVALYAALALVAAAPQPGANAAIIAQWNFETPNPADATAAVYPNAIAPAIGTGNASGVHASALTAWTTPSGNGSADSFSSNNWAIGDYYQFQLTTLGSEDITVSFDQTSSNTGPRDFQFAYSTDGTNFTNFGAPYPVLANAAPNPTWNPTTSSGSYTFSQNLSSVSALDDQPAVYFRLSNSSAVSANGGSVATGGTGRVDNFTVNANPIPEPTTAVSLIGGLAMLVGLRRVRRSST